MSTPQVEAGNTSVHQGHKSRRIVELDAAKGLAILLVVLGHLVARDIKPLGNEWYEIADRYLYTFHMAFFFFLSGLIYFYKVSPPTTLVGYWANFTKRFWRLAPAYILLALVVYIGKLFAQELLAVDRKVEFSVAEAFKLITYPTESYASFLWFIFVLLAIEAIVPLLFWFTRGNRNYALALSAVLFFVPAPKFLALHQIGHYLIFFVLAAPLAKFIPQLLEYARRYVLAWGLLFAGAIALLPFSWLSFASGLLSIPFLLGVVMVMPGAWINVFLVLGVNTFVIYLLNTICIGVTKGVMLKMLSWNGIGFFIFIPFLILAGVLGPIVIKRYLFRRVPWLDRITS